MDAWWVLTEVGLPIGSAALGLAAGYYLRRRQRALAQTRAGSPGAPTCPVYPARIGSISGPALICPSCGDTHPTLIYHTLSADPCCEVCLTRMTHGAE